MNIKITSIGKVKDGKMLQKKTETDI